MNLPLQASDSSRRLEDAEKESRYLKGEVMQAGHLVHMSSSVTIKLPILYHCYQHKKECNIQHTDFFFLPVFGKSAMNVYN